MNLKQAIEAVSKTIEGVCREALANSAVEPGRGWHFEVSVCRDRAIVRQATFGDPAEGYKEGNVEFECLASYEYTAPKQVPPAGTPVLCWSGDKRRATIAISQGYTHLREEGDCLVVKEPCTPEESYNKPLLVFPCWARLVEEPC